MILKSSSSLLLTFLAISTSFKSYVYAAPVPCDEDPKVSTGFNYNAGLCANEPCQQPNCPFGQVPSVDGLCVDLEILNGYDNGDGASVGSQDSINCSGGKVRDEYGICVDLRHPAVNPNLNSQHCPVGWVQDWAGICILFEEADGEGADLDGSIVIGSGGFAEPCPKSNQFRNGYGICVDDKCEDGKIRDEYGICIEPSGGSDNKKGADCPEGQAKNTAGICEPFSPSDNNPTYSDNGNTKSANPHAIDHEPSHVSLPGSNGGVRIPPCPSSQRRNSRGKCIQKDSNDDSGCRPGEILDILGICVQNVGGNECGPDELLSLAGICVKFDRDSDGENENSGQGRYGNNGVGAKGKKCKPKKKDTRSCTLDALGICVDLVPQDSNPDKTCPSGTILNALGECLAITSDTNSSPKETNPANKHKEEKPKPKEEEKPKKKESDENEEECEDDDTDSKNSNPHPGGHHPSPESSHDNDGDNDNDNGGDGLLFSGDGKTKNVKHRPSSSSNDKKCPAGKFLNSDNECVEKKIPSSTTNTKSHSPTHDYSNSYQQCPEGTILNTLGLCVGTSQKQPCPEGTVINLLGTCVEISGEGNGESGTSAKSGNSDNGANEGKNSNGRNGENGGKGDNRDGKKGNDDTGRDGYGSGNKHDNKDNGNKNGDGDVRSGDDNGGVFGGGGKGKNIRPVTKTCPPGETLDSYSNCIKSSNKSDSNGNHHSQDDLGNNNGYSSKFQNCPDGTILNASGICISITSDCPSGAILNAAGVCISSNDGSDTSGNNNDNPQTSDETSKNPVKEPKVTAKPTSTTPSVSKGSGSGPSRESCPDGTIVNALGICVAFTTECPSGSILNAAGVCVTSGDVIGGETSGGSRKKPSSENVGGSKGSSAKCPAGEVRNSVNVCVKVSVANAASANAQAGIL